MGKYMHYLQLEKLVIQKMEAGNHWHDQYYFRLLDEYKYLPSFEELQRFLDILKPMVAVLFPPEEELDCEDFAAFLLGKMLEYEKLLGLKHSMCVGPVEGFFGWVEFPLTELHFCNWAVTDDEEIWWIEPQTAELYAMAESKGGIDLMMA